MTASDPNLALALEVAGELAGGAVEVNHHVAGGRNSRIWHVRAGGREFALKHYPPTQNDPRDRLSAEVGALRLMAQYHVDTVPRVIAVDERRGYALLSWIDGREVVDVGDADIDAAVAFLAAIHELRATPQAAGRPLAAEACLCGREIERQIKQRLMGLRDIAGTDGELSDFIEHSFMAQFDRTCRQARAETAAAKLDFTAELPQEWRSLAPSDFGFHNSLRRNNGSLAFFDFEYFGWDDPVKLTADILLHPGRSLPAPQRDRFRQAAIGLYGGDPGFAPRLAALLPLFGLRWVLILLNEFIPERWHRRVLAGDGRSWSQAKARQLTGAREFLARLQQTPEG